MHAKSIQSNNVISGFLTEKLEKTYFYMSLFLNQKRRRVSLVAYTGVSHSWCFSTFPATTFA